VTERLGDDVFRRAVLGRQGRVQTAEAVRADRRHARQLAETMQVVQQPVPILDREQPIGGSLAFGESLQVRTQERRDL
jgi:hypothetical protein